MIDLPEHIENTALSRVFAGPRRSPDAAWFSLPGGRVLFHAGEAADRLYFLMSGRLGVVRREEGQEPHFLGVIRPGEPAGEMSLIAGTPHTASVVALRDSEIMAIPRAAFLKAIQADPEVMSELAHLMILRARHVGGSTAGEPAVFGFVGAHPGAPVHELVAALSAEIRALGFSVEAVGSEVQRAPPEWFSKLEDKYDIVLYGAAYEDGAWKSLVGRQVDRLFCVADATVKAPESLRTNASPPLVEQRLVDLILLRPGDAGPPKDSQTWLDAASFSRLFHIRHGSNADMARLARVVAGRSVGLVLSGGGARAFAHIGVIRALHEAHVPIDFIGGTSMGAIVAGGVACGWDDKEMDWRIRKAFVESSPLDDIAIPIIAMTRGDKVDARMSEHFGDIEIPDLQIPYFCVSTDLTVGSYHVHRRGLLRRALMASIALPGILPPISEGGHVLVDGGVTKNFPTDVMSAIHRGPIVGADVGEARGFTTEDVRAPASLWKWFASGDWRRGPPIVSVLMRSATISTAQELTAAREHVDLMISPDIGPIEIRDWKAYEPAVEAGYRAASAILEKLDKPVTELRRGKDHRQSE